MARLETNAGYGQLELNNVAFRRDGRIEAQLPLDSSVFSAGVENGAIVGVNNIPNGEGKRMLVAPANGIPGIVYSSEHMYDERTPGLKNFINEVDGFYCRVGYLSVGDKFTTNTFDTGDLEVSAVANGDYCQASSTGIITDKGTSAISTGLVFRVIDKDATMPDGHKAVKLQVWNV